MNYKIIRYKPFKYFKDMILNRRIYFSSPKNHEDFNEMGRHLIPKLKETYPRIDKSWDKIMNQSLISCWSCYSNGENYALWKIYCNSNPSEGVAFKCDRNKLTEEIQNGSRKKNFGFECAKVKYTNDVHEGHYFPIFKSNSYKFEEEYRYVLWKSAKDDSSHTFIPVSPENFIEAVLLSPFSSKELRPKVEKLLHKNSLTSVKVLNSSVLVKND